MAKQEQAKNILKAIDKGDTFKHNDINIIREEKDYRVYIGSILIWCDSIDVQISHIELVDRGVCIGIIDFKDIGVE